MRMSRPRARLLQKSRRSRRRKRHGRHAGTGHQAEHTNVYYMDYRMIRK